MANVATFPRGRIPVTRYAGEAYAAAFEHLSDLLRMAWLPVGLIGVVDYFVLLTVYRNLPASTDASAPETGWLQLLPIVVDLLQLPLVSIIAVAWHRLMLRDEPLGAGGELPLDGFVWRYTRLALILTLCMMLVGLGPSLAISRLMPPGEVPTAGESGTLAGLSLLALVALVVSLVVFVRLSLLLPALAIGRNLTIREVWSGTRGSFWRLLLGALITTVPPALTLMILGVALVSVNPGLSAAWSAAIDTVLTMLNVLASVTSLGFLSLAYRHLFEPPPFPTGVGVPH